MILSNTSRMLRHSIFLLVTLFFMIKVVSSQYGNGATKYRYRNKPIKEREEAVNSLNILRDILQRFEHPSLPYQQNQDIVMEKSRIRLRNPAAAHTAKRQPPVPYYLRNRPVSYDRYETRNNNRHRTSMRNRQQLFYEDFDPSVDRRPAARPPQVVSEKRPQRPSVSAATMTTSRQPIKQLLDLNKDDDNEIHIDGHVHHPDEATYKPVSAYEEPIYQNNHQTESYEEEPNNASYEPNQQQQYQQDGGYAVNLDNHQMVEVKPPADDSYAVTPPEYNRPAYYDEDDKVEKKKYNLKVNLYLHNYRNGRINTANTELIQKETVA